MFELQLYSKASYKLLSSYTHACAFHIDTTTLADGTYELVPEAEEGPGEAQVNFADAIENPNPTPEALETNLAQEGKPRCKDHRGVRP